VINIKATLMFLVVMLCVSVVATAQSLPISIDDLEVNDISISPNQVNVLDVLRGNEIEVQVTLTPSQNVNDLELEVFISGYEHNSFERMSSTSTIFDADENVTYVKYLRLRIPDEVDEDEYRLRLIITGRQLDALIQDYNLKLDVPRHELMIEDVIFFPGGSVEAGKALLVTVRVENKGEKRENDVKVEVRIPELGVSAADYIERIRDGDDEEEETEEMFLRIPTCAKPGKYDVDIIVTFNEGFSQERETTEIVVVESGYGCNKDAGSAMGQGQAMGQQPAQQAPPQVITNVIQTVEQAPSGAAAAGNKGALRKALEVIFFVLLGLLIIVALVVGIKKLKDSSDDEDF